jgi:lipoyl(octanoyl) transferase
MPRGAYVLDLDLVPYQEAWDLQRSLAGAVSQGAIPDTVVFLEHPPVLTLGRRTDEGELHVPAGAEVDVVETDRGGKSTFHGPGQLVCYPILDLKRHGKDVKKYVRDLEEALIRTVAPRGLEDAAFTTIARELGRPVLVDEVRPLARAALGEVFDLSFEELPAEDGHGLWSQSIHGNLAARS